MSISARLKEFRKGTPPTQIHAGRLDRLKRKAFSAYEKLGPQALRSLSAPDAMLNAKAESFYRKMSAMEKKMEKKGIMFSFDWADGTITTADIFHRADINGCPAIFLANSEMSSSSAAAGGPPNGIVPAQYSCLYDLGENSIKGERIAVFADRAESVLECTSIIMRGAIDGLGDAANTIPPETLMSLLGRHYGGPSAQNTPLSIVAGAYSALSNFFAFGKDMSLDDLLVGHIAHELGHMAFSRKFPVRTLDSPTQERFAFAYVLANSPFPHADFAERVERSLAPAGSGSSLHKLASRELVAMCTTFLFGEESLGSPFEELIPKYLQTSADNILSAASSAFESICKSLGATREEFMGNPFERAKKAVFG